MRQGSTVSFLHGDHLGSASVTTNNAGTKIAEMRYAPFGETRYQWSNTPTDKRFTSQRMSSYGTISFPAREYSPLLGRFLSADSIVPRPGDPQSLNRYSYVRNSPLNYTDPTGHAECAAGGGGNGSAGGGSSGKTTVGPKKHTAQAGKYVYLSFEKPGYLLAYVRTSTVLPDPINTVLSFLKKEIPLNPTVQTSVDNYSTVPVSGSSRLPGKGGRNRFPNQQVTVQGSASVGRVGVGGQSTDGGQSSTPYVSVGAGPKAAGAGVQVSPGQVDFGGGFVLPMGGQSFGVGLAWELDSQVGVLIPSATYAADPYTAEADAAALVVDQFGTGYSLTFVNESPHIASGTYYGPGPEGGAGSVDIFMP